MNLITIPRMTEKTKYYIAASLSKAYSEYDTPEELVKELHRLLFELDDNITLDSNVVYALIKTSEYGLDILISKMNSDRELYYKAERRLRSLIKAEREHMETLIDLRVEYGF